MINRGETVRIDPEGQPGDRRQTARAACRSLRKLEDHRLVVRCKAGPA